MIDRTIKFNSIVSYNLAKSTPAAMLREDVNNFGLGRTSICVEHYRPMASVLTSSLEDPSARHRT
eukprot:817585-Pelagomonas_calceolata.AAC.1